MVPLSNRYEALEVEPNDTEDDGSSGLEVLLRLSQPMPCIQTASRKEKRWVIVREKAYFGNFSLSELQQFLEVFSLMLVS